MFSVVKYCVTVLKIMKISLSEAISRLRAGEVVAVPTETVYGLAASIQYPDAVKEIFTRKGRPSNNPLIIHTDSVAPIKGCTETLPTGFFDLAQAFWPGPMTLVLPAQVKRVNPLIRANLPTAAFRIPNHPLALALLMQTGPLVMPSANISGLPSATSADHVESDFGPQFPVLDGGKCTCGLESTIAIFNDDRWRIIRLGALSPEAFLPVLGYIPEVATPAAKSTNNAQPLCPGQLYRHYAPHATLLPLPESLEGCQGTVIGFSDRSYGDAMHLLALGRSDNPQEVAENLYASFRMVDELGLESAWIDLNFPDRGLWATIRERINKAIAKF